MSRYGSAILASMRNKTVHPVIQVDFPDGTQRWGISSFASHPTNSEEILFDGRVTGIERIKHGVPIKPGQIGFPEMRWRVSESSNREITRLVERQDPRRSSVKLWWADPNLTEADWARLFTGVIDTWKRTGPGEWEFVARPDWTQIRSDVPKQPILKGDYPNANTVGTSPYGIYMPVAYGIFDSASLGGSGSLDTTNIWYGGSPSRHFYLISLGAISTLDRVYVDTTLKTVTTHYTLGRGVVGGKYVSYVNFVAGQQPTTSQKVYVDIHGIETVGNGTGSLISNPVSQLQHWLSNFGFGDYKSGNWGTISDLIDGPSWAACEVIANRYGFEGSLYFGGTTEQDSAEVVVENWLKSWPMFRLYWNEMGKLAMVSLSPVLAQSAKAGVIREEDMKDFSLDMDSTNVATRVGISYIYGPKDGKFWSSLDVQDLTQEDKITESVSAVFSASRFV
jgi:hypothetical protein